MSAQPETPLFGTVERRLFRATAVLFSIVAMTGLIAGMVWILGLILTFFYNLVLPLAVAGILALVLHPVVDYIEMRMGVNRLAATGIILLLFVAVIVVAVVMVVPPLIREIAQFAEIVPSILAGWQDYMATRFPVFTRMVAESAQEGELKGLMPGLEGTRKTVRSYAGLVVGLSFVPLMLFFALLSGRYLHSQITEMLSVFNAKTQKNIMYFIDVFIAQVTGFFQGQLVIAMIMGAMFAVGFTLIGLKGGILIGLVLGMLNIVPFLGTLIGLLIVLPLAYFQLSGGFPLLGLSLVVFTVVQLVESWLLTPKEPLNNE